MKVGLYIVDLPDNLGGGYVLRADVARVAIETKGRHEVELVSSNLRTTRTFRSRVKSRLGRIARLQPEASSNEARALEAEVRRRGIQMLWFNHVEPIDVGLPYILTIFDLQHRLQPWFPEVSANGQWEHREAAWSNAVRRASIVTVGSQEAKDQLSFFYGVPLDNIHVVPFPTPRAAIAEASSTTGPRVDERTIREKYGITGDFLFYPAQFWAHKNHVTLLRALRLLQDRDGIKLALVLTGSDKGNLSHVREVAANLGLLPFVHFLGFVPRDDVIALYRFAFALSYVSHFGPENLPPLEAMALECPIVLSNIPGVRTLFGDGPVLVDPRSDASIADGIKWIRDNPGARAERARAGREIAMRNSVEEYLRRVHSILDAFEPMRLCWP